MNADDTSREALIESMCVTMHDAYEAAAVREGWETQERSRKPWAEVPDANKATMRAAVGALYDAVVLPLVQGARDQRRGRRVLLADYKTDTDRLRGERDAAIRRADLWHERWRQLMRDYEAVVNELDRLETRLVKRGWIDG